MESQQRNKNYKKKPNENTGVEKYKKQNKNFSSGPKSRCEMAEERISEREDKQQKLYTEQKKEKRLKKNSFKHIGQC